MRSVRCNPVCFSQCVFRPFHFSSMQCTCRLDLFAFGCSSSSTLLHTLTLTTHLLLRSCFDADNGGQQQSSAHCSGELAWRPSCKVVPVCWQLAMLLGCFVVSIRQGGLVVVAGGSATTYADPNAARKSKRCKRLPEHQPAGWII